MHGCALGLSREDLVTITHFFMNVEITEKDSMDIQKAAALRERQKISKNDVGTGARSETSPAF